MTCREAVKKLYEYLDSELDNASTDEIKRHLDICKLCCDQFEFEKTLKELVGKCCKEAKAPDLLKQKIINTLN